MEGVLEEPFPPDDLRCKRTDGRDWRCKRPIVDGKSFCSSHLYRGQKPRNSSTPTSVSVSATASPTLNPKPKPKPSVRIRLKVKPELESEPVREVGFDPVPEPVPGPVPDYLRCSRNDGRSWRCKKPAMAGQALCEAHLNQAKAKAQNQRKPRIPAKKKQQTENEKSEESFNVKEVGDETLDENFRCGKTKGKDWRCKKRVVEGELFCEVHLKKQKIQGNRKRSKENCDEKNDVGDNAVEIPDNLRCEDRRCKRRVLDGQNLCDVHFKKVKIGGTGSKRMQKEKNDDVDGTHVVVKSEKGDSEPVAAAGEVAGAAAAAVVDMRCKRTDGRDWRCKRRVVEGKTLCDIHYEQGRLRQMKITVPEDLKIQRGEGGEKAEKRLKRKRELENLEKNSDKGMKKMKAELIRVFLRREILESKKKSEKQSKVQKEVTRDLPFGLMSIPPAPPTQFLDNAESLGIKIGANCSNSLVTRRFRSKNIEPLPISTLKAVPYAGNVGKNKSSGRKICHWCRKCDNLLSLIQCSSCRKRYFCSNCIKERSADPAEVKLRCPACRGRCECKACCTNRSKDAGAKGVLKKKFTGSKFQLLQYLINYLLPILVQINQEQSIETEMEAEFKGQNPFDVEILQADVGCREQCCCNNCKSPILDYHRSCPICSYNLCLSCCREYTQGGSYPNRGKTLLPCVKQRPEKSVDLASSEVLPDSTACLHISCPPMELGGCDNSLLDLRCIFPLNWTKELEMSAKETDSEHDFLENTDDSVTCSLCASISQAGNENKELQEASRRKESNDNFLYCPSTSHDHNSVLTHFQKHWRKGHPIKVRNVLQFVSTLSWDPLAMFCSYLENGFIKCKNSKDSIEAPSCSDSYDVELCAKESYIGSIKEGYRHIHHKTLKVKAQISSAFSRKLLEGYYSEIIQGLPLLEYTNPRIGLLNIAGKLPEDSPDSKLGPHVCISCGSREEVARGELVTKLCCNPYDVVNILVHVGNAQCSSEQINKIKNLIQQRNNNSKEKGSQTFNEDMEDEETRIHSGISVEAGDQLRVASASCCVADANDVFAANDVRDDKFSPAKLVNCSDTDSDASMICSRTSHSPNNGNKSVVEIPHLNYLGGLNTAEKQLSEEPCGALWDVFRRQDVPKLLEYITKHLDELRFSCGLADNVIHPIFDGNFYLDAAHKMQLKEEFEIEPWTFNQRLKEAVFIPAGCPYQIRNFRSSVSIASGFVSPENASECIKLINEIRVLPNDHKAKKVKLEVEKMAICSIDEAIKEIYRLRSEEGSH